jgi:hypothetical protein
VAHGHNPDPEDFLGPFALFFTGQKHAGENLDQLLKGRAAELSPPLQMCDALARNQSKTFGITKRPWPS